MSDFLSFLEGLLCSEISSSPLSPLFHFTQNAGLSTFPRVFDSFIFLKTRNAHSSPLDAGTSSHRLGRRMSLSILSSSRFVSRILPKNIGAYAYFAMPVSQYPAAQSISGQSALDRGVPQCNIFIRPTPEQRDRMA